MQPEMQLRMPRPGKALMAVMVSILALWVLFAVRINWVGTGQSAFDLMVGSSSAVLHGEVWRLFTAPLVHAPSDPSHVLVTLLGLYFLGPSLEDRWGPKKMLLFLFGSAAFAFGLQVLADALVLHKDSAWIAVRALPHEAGLDDALSEHTDRRWFGGLGMVEAIAVAWALNNRDARVNLFFVLPVSGTMLLVFIFGMSVFNVIARHAPPEGLVTPFGGMLAGYLFGDASPLRRLWLKGRLRRLQAETAKLSGQRRPRSGPSLHVIQGGGDRPTKDKRYLN
jgi:membrane associated rhomboid family serine protease